MVHRQSRKSERDGALGVELDLARGGVKRVARISDVRNPKFPDAALTAKRGDGGMARGRMVEKRIEGALVVFPGKEVGNAEALGELSEDPNG